MGGISIAARGNIVIQEAGLQANTGIGNVTTGTANYIDITGQGLTINLSNITITSENIIDITGEDLTGSLANVTVAEGTGVVITGTQADTSINNVDISTEQRILITGQSLEITLQTIVPWGKIDTSGAINTWSNINTTVTNSWSDIYI